MTASLNTPAQLWDLRYQSAGHLFGAGPNAYLQSQAARIGKSMHALAVADGDGRNGLWLSTQCAAVDTFDISPVAVAKARAQAAKRQLPLSCHLSGWETFPWRDQAYDIVAAIFIQFAPPGQREVLFKHMRRSLKPGGYLIVQGYRPEQLNYRSGGPDQLAHLYTREWLLEQCAGLAVLDLTESLSVLQEGRAHLGLSATIAVTAQAPG